LAQRQQWKGKLIERPLGFFSRKLHDIETRYPTYDRELLAIHDSLVHWECYVQGRRQKTIYTDHAALQHIIQQRKLSSRQWRHLHLLQNHDYTIKYFPGAANIVADVLSRRIYRVDTKSQIMNSRTLKLTTTIGENPELYRNEKLYPPI
jgi:hypothetical protein